MNKSTRSLSCFCNKKHMAAEENEMGMGISVHKHGENKFPIRSRSAYCRRHRSCLPVYTEDSR